MAGGVEVTSLLLNLSERMALFTTILPEHSLPASSLTRVKVLGLKKCQPESRVKFSVLWRKRNYFASKKKKRKKKEKEKKKAEKKARHQPSSCICLVNALSISQILLARDWFISLLAGPAAVVQTEAGLAPADQAELHRAVALGTRAPDR